MDSTIRSNLSCRASAPPQLPCSLPPGARPLQHLLPSAAAERGLLAARPKQTLTASITKEKWGFFQDITSCRFSRLFQPRFVTVSLDTSAGAAAAAARSATPMLPAGSAGGRARLLLPPTRSAMLSHKPSQLSCSFQCNGLAVHMQQGLDSK